MDVLRAMYLHLTGQPRVVSGAENGRKWMVEPFDLVTATQLWRSRDLGPLRWLRSLRGVDETAWLAADDPLPVAALVARSTGRFARRALSR